jgi:histidine ammonia-lyase
LISSEIAESANALALSQKSKVSTNSESILIQGDGLSLSDIMRVARDGFSVRLPEDSGLEKVIASRAFIERAVEAGEAIYGVTTLFGGLANMSVP